MMRWIENQIQKILQAYRKKSIQSMISVSFTIIAVAGMLFIGLSLFTRFNASNKETVSEYNKRIMEQVNINLDSYLRSMMKVSDSMYYRVIKNKDLSEESIDLEMNLLYETNRDSIVSIAVFNEIGTLVSATPISTVKKMINPKEQEWFIEAANKIENFHFSTPHVQNLFDNIDHKYRWVVSLSRAVELTEGGDIQSGVILVDMNFNGIEQIFKNGNLGTSGYLYLISGDGEIIYHPRQQLLYSNLFHENNNEASNYEDGTHYETFLNEKRIVTVKTVGYTGWKIIGVTPMRDLFHDYFQIRIFMMLILLFTILLMSYINLFISAKIADPIKALENSVKELEAGAEKVDISIGGSYEIRHLGESIRSMVEQMRTLMADIVIEQEAKRKSELDALQGQINPHFLYNTLDSIVWMIENERYPEAIKMVSSFAAFFRISLSKGKNIISVEDELRHAENYSTIQHMRFKNKFIFQITAQEETKRLATIKLIVQPILENAIYHGMEFMDGDGEILIKAYLLEEKLYIDVIDNGLGMPEEVVETLLTKDSKTRGKGSGIGLKNVQERIRLYFGKEYGLTIISEPDEGTTVRICLPIVSIDEIEKDGG